MPIIVPSVFHNLRTDEYGRPIENGARFLLEVFDAIREQCGQEFYIEFQMRRDCMTEDELVRFAGLSRHYFNIGDSSRPGNLQTCNRRALAAAAKL